MKASVKSIAIIAAFSFTAFGCQKEKEIIPVTPIHECVSARTVSYYIDGVNYLIVINNEEDWNRFFEMMAILARQGHSVRFRNMSTYTASPSKEVVTFITTDEQEANKWCAQMTNNGFEVTIEYDERTGKYTCTAVR